MNRIYKSIYNAARRCVVCVSEIQSSRVKTKSERKGTSVKPILSMLSVVVLSVWSSYGVAAPQPIVIGGLDYLCSGGKCNPSGAGGTSNWHEVFDGSLGYTTLNMQATSEMLYESLADGGTGSLTIEEGNTVNITGGSSRRIYAFGAIATAGGVGTITNSGTLLIQSGTAEDAHSIEVNAYGTDSIGTISNGGSGTLTIQGGSGKYASGIYYNANNGGNGIINNTGIGTLTIKGGTATRVKGIEYNAYGSGSIGTISNTGSGTLTIQGGTSLYASGIEYNAYYGGNGVINNESDGILTIQSGSGNDAYAIYYNAYGTDSVGTISNAGSGTLTISGYLNDGIGYNAYGSGSHGKISNTGIGALTIQGGTGTSAYGIEYNAESGGTGIISNEGDGTLTIQAGTGTGAYAINYNAHGSNSTGTIINKGAGTLTIQASTVNGIYYNAYGIGSTGTISNTGAGILMIQGGTYIHANGIEYNANNGGMGTISNEGDGTLTIQGGADHWAYGIERNAFNGGTGTISNDGDGNLNILGNKEHGIETNSFGSDSSGTISNTGAGTLTIQGGAEDDADGIYYNADGSSVAGLISNTGIGTLVIQGGTDSHADGIGYNSHDSDSVGTINNTGDGTIIIQGGTVRNAYGIQYNASGPGSTGTIGNIGTGTLTIQGGVGGSGIFYNADYATTGTIKNIGSGTLTIQGGMESYAYGIEYNSRGSSGQPETSGTISNDGDGDLNILGMSASGIFSNGASSNSIGTISNVGTGTLLIQGGTVKGANGIKYNAYNSGVGVINNLGSCILTIQGGAAEGAYGIEFNAYGSSTGTISNSVNGTLNVFGNEDVGSYAIGYLVSGYKSTSTSLLENAGLMNLNAYAIQKFIENGTTGTISVSVVNKSTGTVNAEVEAIFERGEVESTINAPIPITIYTPNEGTYVAELDSYATKETAVVSGWKLKDDWYNYSTWEDGGKLVITDVVAGSAEAQTIIDSFQDRFGTGTTIEFTGTEVNTMSLNRDGESEKPDFSMWHVDELIANGEIKNGSVVTSEVLQMTVANDYGIVIPDEAEVLSEDDYDPGEYSLVIGDTGEGQLHEYVVNQDIGFKGLAGNGKVTVKDGYSFTLLGEQATMAAALRTTESQATFQLTDSPVTVQADSTLKLGITDLSATQGYFEDLTLADTSAALSVENGIFQITNVTGNGQINVQEKGQLTIANKASAGDVVNNGVLTANTVNTQIGGSAAVATMAEGDQNHFETFTNEKGGEANFADVTVAEGANVKNKAEATINAGAMVVNGGAAITNFKDGILNVDSLEMNGTLRNNGTINVAGDMTLTEGTTTTLAGKVTAGTFSIGRAAEKAKPASFMLMTEPRTAAEITGETYSKVLDLAGGDVVVRKDAILAGIELKNNIVNSHVTVDADGTFAFSYNENQLEEALKDLKLDTEGKALVVLSTDLSFGEFGSLTVGTTDATDTINLGSDALLLLGTDKLHGGAVLDGEGKETLNIKEGAVLAFTDDAIWGNHYIVSDFVSMDAAENLTVKDLEGNILETKHNDKGIYITIGSNNILDKDIHFGLSNNINAIMDGMQDTTSDLADIRYLSQAMGAKDGVKQTNDLQHLSAQAGILSEAYRLTDNAHESIIRHAMSDKYANVWVEALAGKGGVDGAETGYSDASYDSDSYGMIFGLDGRIGESINVGAALHYQKGDLEADSSETKNEFKNYGASIYAATNFGKLNVTAGLTYAKGDHEFNQVNLGYVEGDTDTEIFMGGIRASYPFMMNRILITPYAGLEAVHVKEDGFTAKIGGAEAFDFGSVSETFGRVPMGVKFSGGNERFAGYADISVIPQFGNRDAKQSVSGVNTKATDIAKFDYADSVLGRVKMGAAYQLNDSTTLGVSYGASMGNVRDLSHEFSLNAKYRF